MNLLWNSEHRPVSNLRSTTTRTEQMTNRLDTKGFEEYDQHLASLYQNSVTEYSPNFHDTSAFFLPHRGIHRHGKLRVVFDGFARDGDGKSPNSFLDPGMNLLSNLLSVLLNFGMILSAARAISEQHYTRSSFKRKIVSTCSFCGTTRY